MLTNPIAVTIKCFKNDGSIHRTWRNSFLIDNNEDYFIVASQRAIVTENNNRKWVSKEPAITFFSKKRWFNVIAMLKSPNIGYYVNLASPSILDGDAIKYVDYDVDLKLNFDNEIKVLDLNEYANHKKKMHYDPKLDLIIKETSAYIKDLMLKRKFPFDDSAVINYYYDFLEKGSN